MALWRAQPFQSLAAWACPEKRQEACGGWGCYPGLLLQLGPQDRLLPDFHLPGSEGGGWRAGLATRTFQTLEQEGLASWALTYWAPTKLKTVVW